MTTNAIEAVSLLVVSQEPAVVRPLCSIGKVNCWHVETAGNGWEALERLERGAVPDLLLLELAGTAGTNGDGLHMLRAFRTLRSDLPIILISNQGEAGRKQEAIRCGVQEILVRPLQEQQLESAIRRGLASAPFQTQSDIHAEDVEALGDGTSFVVASPVMRNLRAQAKLFAQAQIPVLILGESGCGKSTAAQLIHGLSLRCRAKLLEVNCAAHPGHLLEEELFGCETNAETRSGRAHPGKLEVCEKGTLLLEEIVEMPPDLQHKVLHVLQSKQLVRVGGDKPITVDVRILATTSANIERAVAAKKLRQDLYYCLSAFTLEVPPLRQRVEEVPLLLNHFMEQLARQYSLPSRAFSKAVLAACQRYSWPGNLIELERFVKRYLVMRDHEFLSGQEPVPGGMGDVGYSFSQLAAPLAPSANDSWEQTSVPDSLKLLVQTVKLEAEKNAISAALQKTGWNRKAAARMLKVSYRTVLYKIDRYHLRPIPDPEVPEKYAFSGTINRFKGTEQ